MLYMGKHLLLNRHKDLLADTTHFTKNQFVNNKIMLYQWIRPEFIDAKVTEEYVRDTAVFCRLLNKVHTPTEKLHCIVEIAKLVYKHGGRSMGQEDFLPVFIFTFVHHQVPDIFYNLLYITKYMPVSAPECEKECTHVNTNHTRLVEDCECSVRVPTCSAREVSFYLTNFEATVTFIERLEFTNLNVSRSEYDQCIESHSHKVDTTRMDTTRPTARMGVLETIKNTADLFRRFINGENLGGL